MSEPAITFAPNCPDDVGRDLPDAHGATAADIVAAAVERHLDDASIFCAVMDDDTFRAMHAIIHAIEELADFILSHPADLPPAGRATAQPPAAEVRADCGREG